jgi:hypothetical protein
VNSFCVSDGMRAGVDKRLVWIGVKFMVWFEVGFRIGMVHLECSL